MLDKHRVITSVVHETRLEVRVLIRVTHHHLFLFCRGGDGPFCHFLTLADAEAGLVETIAFSHASIDDLGEGVEEHPAPFLAVRSKVFQKFVQDRGNKRVLRAVCVVKELQQ